MAVAWLSPFCKQAVSSSDDDDDDDERICRVRHK